jgi:hypothetical protein
MVLTDDNYASIVSAIEQGRVIYANIRKFVFFLLSSNVAEIMIIFLATLAGLPTPLTAIQLLWLNLITDGAPALALAVGAARRSRRLLRGRAVRVRIRARIAVRLGIAAGRIGRPIRRAIVVGVWARARIGRRTGVRRAHCNQQRRTTTNPPKSPHHRSIVATVSA